MIEFDGSKIKATMPLITNEELETIDNNLHDIVDEFIKRTVKDKDLLISQYIIKKLEEENKQLKEQLDYNSKVNISDHNIVDELEKWLEEEGENPFYPVDYLGCICSTLNKIKILKEMISNE